MNGDNQFWFVAVDVAVCIDPSLSANDKAV